MTAKGSLGKKPYKVGKNRPPVESRFKPGQSGNKKGRPKGSKNAKTLAKAELRRKVVVTVKGRKRTLTVAEVASRRLGDKAMEGDVKAYGFLIAIADDDSSNDSLGPNHLISPVEDEAILANYLARRSQSK